MRHCLYKFCQVYYQVWPEFIIDSVIFITVSYAHASKIMDFILTMFTADVKGLWLNIQRELGTSRQINIDRTRTMALCVIIAQDAHSTSLYFRFLLTFDFYSFYL
jgi:hypothetical protein